MYRTVNRSSIRCVVNWLPAMFLLAALSLLAANVDSAAGSSERTGKTAKHSARHKTKRPTPAGVVFGGVTSAGGPIVVEVSRDGREIVRATIAVQQKCQPSGMTFFFPDSYTHVPIKAAGAFRSAGEWSAALTEPPVTGVTNTDSLSGSFNRAGTSVTGTWSLVSVFNGATGAPIDRCDSGAVSFTATQ